MPAEIDRTPGYVNQLSNSMTDLAESIGRQGIGVSEKLDYSSSRIQKSIDASTARISEALDRASASSERHAKNLVTATWALAFATLALVIATGALVLFPH